jgi:hypothetical protein
MSSQKPFDDAFKDFAEHAAEALLQLTGPAQSVAWRNRYDFPTPRFA